MRFLTSERLVLVDVLASEGFHAYLEAAQRLVDAAVHHPSADDETVEVLAPAAASITAARITAGISS